MIKFLILMTLVEFISCFKSKNFCQLNKNDCTGRFDSDFKLEVTCKYEKCLFPYEHQCGQDKCALNIEECAFYLQTSKHFLKLIKYPRVDPFKLFNQKNLNKLENELELFNKNIETCPVKSIEWKPEHVCEKMKYCLRKEEVFSNHFIFRTQRRHKLVQIECPCLNKHAFKCDLNHCALNKNACDEFKKFSHRKDIKKCNTHSTEF
jgi:hypothetical protein